MDIFLGVEGVTADFPVWYYDADGAGVGNPAFRCNLRCHGVVMATCFYKAELGGVVSPGFFWCAGGTEQRASSSSGAL